VRLPPFALDHEVARLKLASLGIEIDVLSVAQERYLRSFRLSKRGVALCEPQSRSRSA